VRDPKDWCSETMIDIPDMSDDELERRIMVVLKNNCDKASLPYPPKLITYLNSIKEREKP
jgi:hypothetical protein